MTFYFTDTKPTLPKLLSLPFGNKNITVMKSLAPQWKTAAILLGLDDERVKIIESNSLPPHQTEKACTEMLREWIKGDKATWNALLELLENENIKLLRLASDLRHALMSL